MKPPAKASKRQLALEFPINVDTAQESIGHVVDAMDERCVLEFFDFFHPQISDPGAYVSVVRDDDGLKFQMGNHGWSTGWKPITRDGLVDYIYKNREHNQGKYFVKARYKEHRVVKTPTGTTQTSYYFDLGYKKKELGHMLLSAYFWW